MAAIGLGFTAGCLGNRWFKRGIEIIAVLTVIIPLWALLHLDFIPMGVRYSLETSKDKDDTQ